MDRRISLLRLLACFMVVQLHVAAEVYGRWGPGWWAGNVYDSLTRACVPLFFMIAGATLLRRDEPVDVFLRRRASRVIPPLLLWSAFYLWWLWYNGAFPADWSLLRRLVAGPVMFHLWYFYALVGVYATVPLLRKFYLHGSPRDHLWFLGVWLAAASLIPTARDVLSGLRCEGALATDQLTNVYHLGYFVGYPGFLLLGAFLADKPLRKRSAGAAFLAASLATVVASAWLSRHFSRPCEYFFVYLSPLVIVAAAGLFSWFMADAEVAAPRWLTAISDCTLGIYGLHVFMIDPLFKEQGWVSTAGNPWISAPLVAAGVFGASLVAVFLVRLVKPLRRWV
ncbi:MAG: acyltransferase [Ramlibacter sp.]